MEATYASLDDILMAAPKNLSPRILSLLDGPPAPDGIGRAAALGFDTVLAAAASDLDREMLAADARRHGLALLLDLAVDRALAADVQAGAPANLFTVLPAPLRDPRRAPQAADVALPAIASPQEAEALADWLAQQVQAWTALGAQGVRLTGLDNLAHGTVPVLLTRLRQRCPEAVLFAWTPGLGWDLLAQVPKGTLDLVALSLPWWDGQADWLWHELDLLRRIAPVVVPAGSLALASALADGWMATLAQAETSADQVAGLNRLRAEPAFGMAPARLLSPPGAPVTALLRVDAADPRQAAHGTLVLVNTDAHAPATVAAAALLPEAAAAFGPFHAMLSGGPAALTPSGSVTLDPGAACILAGDVQPAPAVAPLLDAAAERAAHAPRLAIEAPAPCVDGGRFPARRTVGSLVEVQADIIGDGHDKLAVALRWQGPGQSGWRETRMQLINNDRWTGSFPLEMLGLYRYDILAWRPAFTTYVDELSKKWKAGVPISLELQEGAGIVRQAAGRDTAARPGLERLVALLAAGDADAQREALLSDEAAVLMDQADDRPHLVRLDRSVPVQAERTGAGFASWYEVFPRSMSDDPNRHGTFADVERHLPRIQAMGFDVLYFPPIHPIGRVNRKGRNNTLTPTPDDPGSPYAIGSEDGGHDALHPELGTLEDFQHLRAACTQHGLELAIDFAIQCSPDHPWLKQHKDWFTWRPDGTIRYAENPPKRYEDIVNVDFYAPGAVPGLWMELCRAVMFWAEQGVRLFRVDNPHTKPLPFWEWMIAEVQARFPDSVFLAEAFTRPKVMYRLAKAGFSQSYTYFTWRETKAEFQEYLTELTQGPPKDFFRPHFFVNTPDINPVYLQGASRGAYLVRAALAATLSGLWGVYNGFELCEGTPMPGKEEYLDSEKYQIRAWDWDRPGNIVAEITQLNLIRRRNPALHSHLGVTFLPASGDRVLFFEKASPGGGNRILVAISMDPSGPQYAELTVSATEVVDLLTGQGQRWSDRIQRITLPPDRPYAIWRIRSAL